MKIICDTREKKYSFHFHSYNVETVRRALKTGDFSIENYEDKITIDRKRNTNELNLCFALSWKRFYRELQRMASFDEAYIMCTFPYEDIENFPINSGIPKSKWPKLRTSSGFLKKRIREIEEEFPNIKFIFTYSNVEAEEYTYNLLKAYYDKQTNIIQ